MSDLNLKLIDHRKMTEALTILKRFNHISNDLDAYLFHIIEWAQGEEPEKPTPEQYGIEEISE